MATSMRLDKLIKEAEEACEFRGHTMGAWTTRNYGEYACGSCECVVCHAQVTVVTDPLPNSIDIGGSAVALHCC